MKGTFWALVPPLVAILLALVTKEAYSSLFVGILIGALFLTGFNPIGTLDTIINDGLISAISSNAGIFLFLLLSMLQVDPLHSVSGQRKTSRPE